MDGVRREGRVNPETVTVPRRFERELEEMGKAAVGVRSAQILLGDIEEQE